MRRTCMIKKKKTRTHKFLLPAGITAIRIDIDKLL